MFEKKPRIKAVVKEPDTDEPRIYQALTIFNDNNGEGMTGSSITYKNRYNQIEKLFIPSDYKPYSFDGYKYVGKIAGNNSACPISRPGWLFGKPVDPDMPGRSMDLLFANDYGARQGLKMKGKADIPWTIIIISLIIATVVIIGIIQFNKNSSPDSQTTSQR